MNLAFAESELPVRLRFDRSMTDEELMRFCAANEPALVEREANGEVLVMTPAGFGTGRINSRITRSLDEWAEADGRGVVTDSNGGYALADGSVRAPDAAWVSLRRLERLSEEEKKGFAPVCPEFVVELRSPTDKLDGLRTKMEMWIGNGAEVAWLVDPVRKAVEIYRAGEQPEIHEEPTSVQGSGPVAGFELVLARIWA